MLGIGRRIRLRSLLILVAACSVVCGLGVQLYRSFSPLRRSVSQLRPGNSALTRLGAVERLANASALPPWEREEAYKLLLSAVNDSDPQVRSLAVNVLARYREHAAEIVSAVVGLTRDADPRVREQTLFTLEGLVKRGSPEAQTVIQAAVTALDDPKPAVRLEAGRALYVLGQGSRAVPALARLVREETGNHRLGALGFLLRVKTIPPELDPTLRAMMKSDYVWERIWARQALILYRMPAEEREAMIKAMASSSQNAERLEGARLLVHFGRSEGAIPVLRELAAHGSAEERARAQTLLHEALHGTEDIP